MRGPDAEIMIEAVRHQRPDQSAPYGARLRFFGESLRDAVHAARQLEVGLHESLDRQLARPRFVAEHFGQPPLLRLVEQIDALLRVEMHLVAQVQQKFPGLHERFVIFARQDAELLQAVGLGHAVF